MTFEFEIVDTAVANASVKDNAFVTMLDGAESPFKDLTVGKSIQFTVPASTPEEIKAAEKLKKDLGDHIRHLRTDKSPLVRSRDDNGKRHFVATITEKVERKRGTNGDTKPAKPTGKPAAK